MRLIDADALKAEIQRRRKRYKTLTGVDMAMLIDDAPTIDGWINVEDRLPEGRGEIYAEGLEDSAWVLAACTTPAGEREYGLATYVRDHERPEDSGWCGIINEIEEIDDRHAKVTHWMPLPEMPEEGEAHD